MNTLYDVAKAILESLLFATALGLILFSLLTLIERLP